MSQQQYEQYLVPADHDHHTAADSGELDRVICKDGRVFHACEICRKRRSRCDGAKPKCTSCQKRGLECEYRAMRKRGRHGKKVVAAEMSPLDMATSSAAVAAAAAAAAGVLDGGSTDSVWSIASPVSAGGSSHHHQHHHQQHHQLGGPGLHSPDSALGLLDSFPRFFSMPTDLPLAAAAAAAAMAAGPAMAMDTMIHAINSASPPAHLHHHHHHQQSQQNQQAQALFSPTSPMGLSFPTTADIGAAAAAASLSAHGTSMRDMARHAQSMDMIAGMSADPSPGSFHQQQQQAHYHQHQHHHHQPAQQQQQQQQQQRFLSPAFTTAFLSSINATQQQHQQQQHQHQQQAYGQPLLFGSSAPSAIAIPQHQHQHQHHQASIAIPQHRQAPMVFRSLSAASSAFDGSNLGLSPSSSSLSMVAAAASLRTSFASPGVDASSISAAVAAFQFSSPPPMLGGNNAGGGPQEQQQQEEVAALLANHPHAALLAPPASATITTTTTSTAHAQQPHQPMALSFPLNSADLGATGAGCFPPPPPPPPLLSTTPAPAAPAAAAAAPPASQAAKPRRARSRQASAGARFASRAAPLAAAALRRPGTGGGGRRGAGANRKRGAGGDWSRSTFEEQLVLDGLNAEGADSFGRPLFDVAAYPLPAPAELHEHMNGTFEYFYIGGQTMHEVTFRKRIAGGGVSPVLIYAIMAIASRYSRRPSLHSLNGMAFLNGDRHASTACGLTSILLNHGDLGTVDTIHGMLFLSVYFMGQGNMLKSRMYLVKAVCTARTMGFQNMDATFVPSSPMIAFRGTFDKPQDLSALHPRACSCPTTIEDRVALETKRRIWWFLVFVDYFTANVMNVPLEIPPDSYCVRLPCSDEEWKSPTLSTSKPDRYSLLPGGAVVDGLLGISTTRAASATAQSGACVLPCDLGFGDRLASARQGLDYLRLNGFHDCRPPWLYRPGAFYLERLMIEFCDHLRRLNNLRSLANRSFFHVEPVFVDEAYPYLKRRRQQPSNHHTWMERLNKVKSSWSWLHMQLNKWLDSILLRFSEEINRVPSDQYNRQYRHQYYYYLIAAHSTIIMSHGVILQLYSDFSRYIRQQQQQQGVYAQQMQYHQQQVRAQMQGQPGFTAGDMMANSFGAGAGSSGWASPPPPPLVDYGAEGGGMALGEGLSEFAIGTFGSAVAPLINIAQGLAASGGGGSSVHGSSIYGSVIGSPITNAPGVLPSSTSSPSSAGHNQQLHTATTSSGFEDLLQAADIEMGDGTNRFGPPHSGVMAAAAAVVGGGSSSLGLNYISTGGMPSVTNPVAAVHSVLHGPHAAINILGDVSEMAVMAWNGCVSTAEQLASILRGKHPKFVLLGSPPLDVFREQVLSGDANILSLPGSAFNAPGTGPGADNPILSDPDFYMRLQPSTAWWMFLVAQVQVGHIKRLLKESEGSFKVSDKRKILAARAAKAAADAAAKNAAAAAAATGETGAAVTGDTAAPVVNDASGEPMDQSCGSVDAEKEIKSQLEYAMEEQQLLQGILLQRADGPAEQLRPLSTNVNNSAIMLATAVHKSNTAEPLPPPPPPPRPSSVSSTASSRQVREKTAATKNVRATRLVRSYENLSCMVKVLEGMQQYWQCMDYVKAIQDILKGSEDPLH